MNYDSEEEKKQQQSFAEKLKAVREFMGNKDNVRMIQELMENVQPLVQELNDKARAGEKLTDEEMQFLDKGEKDLKKIAQSLSDMKLLLGHNMTIQADAIFFHVRKLAQEGDEKAKKAYEQLLPGYKKAHGFESGSPEQNN